MTYNQACNFIHSNVFSDFIAKIKHLAIKLPYQIYVLTKYFSYRNRFKGDFFENQLLSKSNRKSLGIFRKIDQINEAIEETNSKYFRRYYNKTKTKRLVKLRKIINQEIDIKEINNMKLLQ